MVEMFFPDLFEYENLNHQNISIIYLPTYERGTSFVILKIYLIKTHQSLSDFPNFLLFIVSIYLQKKKN